MTPAMFKRFFDTVHLEPSGAFLSGSQAYREFWERGPILSFHKLKCEIELSVLAQLPPRVYGSIAQRSHDRDVTY